MEIAARVSAGEGIHLTVKPVYYPSNKTGIPDEISMVAVGDNGYIKKIYTQSKKDWSKLCI